MRIYCMYVRMYVRMYVCTYMCAHTQTHILYFAYACVPVYSLSTYTYICMYSYTHDHLLHSPLTPSFLPLLSSLPSPSYVPPFTPGRFALLSSSGKVEKMTEGHTGAVLAVRWSHDGTALATGTYVRMYICTYIHSDLRSHLHACVNVCV